MSDVVYSNSGIEIAIAADVVDNNLSRTEFEALTYAPIANVGSLGEYGITTNINAYDSFDKTVTTKTKGLTDGGNPTLECARNDSDPGQAILIAAGPPSIFSSRAIRVTKQDGAVDYLRGLISGPSKPGGRNEDFDLLVFTIALNQVVEHVEFNAPPLVWIFDSGTLASDGIITATDTIPA